LQIQKMLMCFVILVCLLTIASCKKTVEQIEPAEIHLLIPSPDDRAPNLLIIDKIYTAAITFD
jgi:hypothetical protein